MYGKQIWVFYAVCRIQITCDYVKEQDYGQLADVHFQSKQYVVMAQERTTKFRAEYFIFVHKLQNNLTWNE
jgi:hypothetical protein